MGKHKKQAMIGYNMRFHAGLKQIKSWLESGRIGSILSADFHFGEYLPGMHPYEDYRHSHAARQSQGGGVILALSHEIDTACWLLGIPNRVYATGGKLSSLEIDVEDTAHIIMEVKNKKTFFPVHIHLNFIEQPSTRNMSIVGEKGKILWDYYENRTKVYDNLTQEWEEVSLREFDRNEMYLDEMRQFLHSVNENEVPAIDLKQSKRILEVILACKKSLKEKEVVVL
jgi:predicted dehydrogenase